ncbi:SCO family protein [soil metagenome]
MSEEPTRTIHPLTIWGPIIVIVCGLVIFWNYMLKLKHESDTPRLPILSRLEKNLVLTESSGKQVELKDVKGKVIVACWVFTRCPRGCAGVVGELLSLYQEIGSEEGIQFISFSVDPDDTPEQLHKFAENLHIKGDNWWFVNGVRDEVRTYMTRYFGFMDVQDVPEKDRLSPDDKFLHDMKVGLADHDGHVRGFYDIASYDPEFKAFWKEKIRKDIKTLLKERDAAIKLEKANP